MRVDSYSLELGAAPKPAAARCTSPQNTAPSTTATATPTRSSPARAGPARANGAATARTPAAYFAAPDGAAVVAAVRGLFAEAGRAPGPAAGPHWRSRWARAARASCSSRASSEPAWIGRLEQRALLGAAGGAIELGGAPLWEAGALLTGDPAQCARRGRRRRSARYIRWCAMPDQSTKTVPFKWDSLGREERAWLDLAPASELRATARARPGSRSCAASARAKSASRTACSGAAPASSATRSTARPCWWARRRSRCRAPATTASMRATRRAPM